MAIMGGFSIRMGYNKINRMGAANGDKGDIAYGGRHLDIGGGSDCICSDGAFGEMDGAISAQNQFWTDHPGSRTKVASKENGTPTMGGFMFIIGIFVAAAASLVLFYRTSDRTRRI